MRRETLDIAASVPILNQMVDYHKPNLDRTFAALADPTRRALLARLSEKEDLSVSELAKPFSMSLPAVMKHLRVLEHAGLLTQKKSGRTRHCRLAAEPLKNAEQWISQYRIFWEGTLDSLKRYLSQQETKEDRSWPRRNRNPNTRSK